MNNHDLLFKGCDFEEPPYWPDFFVFIVALVSILCLGALV